MLLKKILKSICLCTIIMLLVFLFTTTICLVNVKVSGNADSLTLCVNTIYPTLALFGILFVDIATYISYNIITKTSKNKKIKTKGKMK